MDRILQYLGDYAVGLSYGDLPEEVVDRAKHLLADTLGCALGTAQSPPAVIASHVGPLMSPDRRSLPYGSPFSDRNKMKRLVTF